MDENFEKISSFDNLYTAFGRARKGSFWKDSIIEYDLNRILYSAKISRQLKANRYKLKGYYKFTICEREKIRKIQSLHITDRVVQHSLCDLVLIPTMKKSWVYDNGASQKNKGTRFSRDRLKKQMLRYYRKHGLEGYVLQMDVKKYFESIPHWYLKERMRVHFSDMPQVLEHLEAIIDSFEGDKGIGLGSQVSQLFALEALSPMDHLIKDSMRIHYFSRYMDDITLIHPSKEYLYQCRDELKAFLESIGLSLHPKKTQIFPLKKGIRYLGFHFYLTETGGIYIKLSSNSEKRMKRKIRKMAKLGKPDEEIKRSFYAWAAHASYGNNYYRIKRNEKYMFRILQQRREENA